MFTVFHSEFEFLLPLYIRGGASPLPSSRLTHPSLGTVEISTLLWLARFALCPWLLYPYWLLCNAMAAVLLVTVYPGFVLPVVLFPVFRIVP